MYVNQPVNDWIETKVCEIFNASLDESFNCERNNLNSNDIDLLLTKNNFSAKVDVQYSFNFKKFGDVRIDLISAGMRKQEFKDTPVTELNQILLKSKNPMNTMEDFFDIKKMGKYFQDQNTLGVFYWLYNQSKPSNLNVDFFKNTKISNMVFIPTSIILQELKNNTLNHIYKINDKTKNGLNEKHDSAFICLNVKSLCEKYNIPLFSNKLDIIEKFPVFLNKQFTDLEHTKTISNQVFK